MSGNRKTLIDPIVDSNPITTQILGICSALAVTRTLFPALVMSIAVIAVLAFSNVAVSLLRRGMPHSVRIIIEVTIIATGVIVVDEFLRAFLPDVSRARGGYGANKPLKLTAEQPGASIRGVGQGSPGWVAHGKLHAGRSLAAIRWAAWRAAEAPRRPQFGGCRET